MSFRVTLVAVLLAVATVAPGLVVADTPSLSVTVNGEQTADGSEVVLNRNPDVGIEASASDSIETIVVRINGESVRTYSPNSSEFSDEFTAQLEENEHNTLKIIVRDGTGDVESQQLTLTKDGIAPFIGFDSPFESKLGSRPPDQVSETQSRLTFSGTFEDITGVRVFSIERRHFYTAVGERRVAETNQQIRDPGSSFSTDLFLGYGRNVITFTMMDRFQNARSYTVEVMIDDDSAPELSVDETPSEIRRSSVLINGTVSDDVQVDEVRYSVEGRVDSATIVASRGIGADPERQSMNFQQQVPLNPGENTVRVTARDASGRTTTIERTVFYNDTVVPEMAIERAELSSGSVQFDGFVRFGSFTDVSVETQDPESGETLDFQQVYSGEPTGRNVTFDERMSAVADGPTEVVLRVVDADGDEHVRVQTVEPEPSTPIRTAEATATTAPGGTTAEGGRPTLTDDGSDVGAGEAGGDGPSESVRYTIPGFGLGHVIAAIVVFALVLHRRRA